MIGCQTGPPAGWRAGWLTGWLAGLLAGEPAGCLQRFGFGMCCARVAVLVNLEVVLELEIQFLFLPGSGCLANFFPSGVWSFLRDCRSKMDSRAPAFGPEARAHIELTLGSGSRPGLHGWQADWLADWLAGSLLGLSLGIQKGILGLQAGIIGIPKRIFRNPRRTLQSPKGVLRIQKGIPAIRTCIIRLQIGILRVQQNQQQ